METLKYQKEVKAIKEHLCGLCECRISKGEKYLTATHKYDRQVYDFKTHIYCTEIARRLDMFRLCDDEGLTGEYFQETISDIHFDTLVSPMTIEERSKFSEIIQQIRSVYFRVKLFYVISHFKKLDGSKKEVKGE